MREDIITSWQQNAEEWDKIITNNVIPSRKFTNTAIIEVIKMAKAKKVADIGCGEGWLTREMTKLGIEAIGIDAIPFLLESARKKGPEKFYQITFEDIIRGKRLPHSPYDLMVFNFCIYQEKGLKGLIGNSLDHLVSNGILLIQTLHPFFLVENSLPYTSQWIDDAWKGLPGNFINGHSWYARTLNDWSVLLNSFHKTNLLIREVVNDEKKPVSLLLELKKYE